MALIFEGVYQVVHELENSVQQGQEIKIKTYADHMKDAFKELCAQLLLLLMHESLKELYESDVKQMREDVEKLKRGSAGVVY